LPACRNPVTPSGPTVLVTSSNTAANISSDVLAGVNSFHIGRPVFPKTSNVAGVAIMFLGLDKYENWVSIGIMFVGFLLFVHLLAAVGVNIGGYLGIGPQATTQ
jgi:hypothetical protein